MEVAWRRSESVAAVERCAVWREDCSCFPPKVSRCLMPKNANISARCPTIAPAPNSENIDNLRNYRYQEIELFAKDALKKLLYVSVYNTTGQNDADESRNSAPKALSDKLDPKRIAKQYQALAAADEHSPLLDGGLAYRPGRRGAEF